MRARVNTRLNIRVGSPSTHALNPSWLYPGQTVEVVKLVLGSDFEGNSIWARLESGAFAWAGGLDGLKDRPYPEVAALASTEVRNDLRWKSEFAPVAKSLPSGEESLPKELFDYNQLVRFNPDMASLISELRNNQGAGMLVGVMDTGIDFDHKNLSGSATEIHSGKDYTSSPHGQKDKYGHGSSVAGLIAGRQFERAGINGVAPMAGLLNLKVIKDDFSVHFDGWKKALLEADEIAGNGPLILNMSLEIPAPRFLALTNDPSSTISEIIRKRVCVAAGGNNADIIRYPIMTPARHQDIISVGWVKESFLHAQYQSGFDGKVDFLVHFPVVTSCNAGTIYGLVKERGSSMATALVSGIAALVQKKEPSADPEKVKAILNKIAIPFDRVSPDMYHSILFIKPNNQTS